MEFNSLPQPQEHDLTPKTHKFKKNSSLSSIKTNADFYLEDETIGRKITLEQKQTFVELITQKNFNMKEVNLYSNLGCQKSQHQLQHCQKGLCQVQEKPQSQKHRRKCSRPNWTSVWLYLHQCRESSHFWNGDDLPHLNNRGPGAEVGTLLQSLSLIVIFKCLKSSQLFV